MKSRHKARYQKEVWGEEELEKMQPRHYQEALRRGKTEAMESRYQQENYEEEDLEMMKARTY